MIVYVPGDKVILKYPLLFADAPSADPLIVIDENGNVSPAWFVTVPDSFAAHN